MGARWLLALLATVGLVVGADAAELRIRYAESVRPEEPIAPGASKPGAAHPLTFTAYGRVFQTDLEINERVLRSLSQQKQQQLGAVPYRGSLVGIAGSWVRLTQVGTTYSGAIWDGNELYLVSPANSVAAALESSSGVGADDTVIFRLADAEGGVLEGTCGTSTADATETNANARYRALITELKGSAPIMQAATVRGQFEVSVLTDSSYTAMFGDNPTTTLLSHMNVVDGIYAEQVGVFIIPTDLTFFNADNDPFTSSAPSTLLSQVATYRNQRPTLQTRSLTHLLTGRDLSGNTIGLGYLAGVCDPRYGASLSEGRNNSITPLIIAHELGHNFGAPHDAEANSPCANTPGLYLMNPQLNYSRSFSACSLQQMEPVVSTASCRLPAQIADVTVEAAAITTPINVPFSFPLTVRSTGNAIAENVRLHLGSAGFPFRSVDAPSGVICTALSSVECTFGNLAPGESRQITVNAHASPVVATWTLYATASANNDRNPNNDRSTFNIQTFAGSDVSIVASAPRSVLVGDPFDVVLDASATGLEAAANAVVTFAVSSRFDIDSATPPSGVSCTIIPRARVTCPLGSLPSGEQRRIVVRVRARASGGPFEFGTSIFADNDASSPNNIARFMVNVEPRLDIGLVGPDSTQIQIVGVPFDYPINIVTRGLQSATGATFNANVPAGVEIQGVLSTSGTCQIDGEAVSCTLGTLAPDTTERITLRLLATQWLSTNINAWIAATDDDFAANDHISLSFQARYRADVHVDPNTSMYAIEEQLADRTLVVQSLGTEAATNVTVRAVFPVGVTVASATFQSTPCTIADSTVECSLPSLNPNSVAWFQIQFTAASAGTFTVPVTIGASNDGNAANNRMDMPLLVEANTDVRIDSVPERITAGSGDAITVPIVLASGRRAVTGMRFTAVGFYNMTLLAANTPDGGTCTLISGAVNCEFDDLDPNVTRRVDISARVNEDLSYSYTSSLFTNVYAPQDRYHENDTRYIPLELNVKGDAVLTVAQTTVTAVQGQSFALPTIRVNSLRTLDNLVLSLTLPSNFSVATMNGACNLQSTVVRCQLGTMNSGSNFNLDATLFAQNIGTSTIDLQLSSPGDQDAQNNTASITVTVNAPPPPSNGGGSGGSNGGGGGAMEWQVLLGLLLLSAGRRRMGCQVCRRG